MKTSRRQFLQATGSLVVCFSLPGCAKQSASGAGTTALGNRILINWDGRVTVYPGKVELGQGIGTAIAQLVADGLSIDIGRISLADVDTDFSPNESYTYSSISIQQSGPAFARAAQIGRRHLLQRAASMLGADLLDVSSVDGQIVLRGKATNTSYWTLLREANTHDVVDVDDVAVDLQGDADVAVGNSIARLDIPDKVFALGSFIQDIRLPKMVHARIVCPPAERATIATYNVGTAESMSGVQKIIRDGNFVAVVAQREQQARLAANELSQSIEWHVAGDLPDAQHIHDWLSDTPSTVSNVVGGSAKPIGSGGEKHSATYTRPFHAHASIAPSMAIAFFRDGQLTIWSHAQGMYPLRTAIAHTLRMDVDKVRCIYKQSAGCYGHNGADDAACEAAAIALEFPNVPVRLQWERADEFAWEPYGSAMKIDVSADLDDDSMVTAWNYDVFSCAHTSRPRDAANAGNFIYAQHKANPLPIPAPRSIPQPAGGEDRNAVPLYEFAATNVVKHLASSMPIRVSSLRGLGAYANVFAIESFMDELAGARNVDPLGFRLAHLGDDRAKELLTKLADVSGWSTRPKGGTGIGWGLGFAQFKNLSSYVGVVFELTVAPSTGRIELRRAVAVCDAGKIVNPDGVVAQIEGGIIQSASWTIKECLQFSKNQITSRDWASYPILRFDEIPQIEVHLMQRSNHKSLGVGESAQGPTAAAIANAVSHACSQRIRNLPIKASAYDKIVS